ncbi:phosphoadenylylsulfate reductase (thioredoxin) [Hydrogenispora ethanolica]|uniref:Adenosine 5'-phosphosulfate reductase n=1 Tax=Hydrogenispora ethanolica TaxID=1082276 RepID=A0A4R1R9D0_HYDET|nr:phosphoadenylylsulfate reductase (thioredoxin) [Hydrogenispora ethanolica]
MQMELSEIQSRYGDYPAPELLREMTARYGSRIALASSLGAEDQVLTDMLLAIDPAARIFVLDTGRLPQETYATIQATMRRYHFHYEIYAPDSAELEALVREHGPDLFYESIELRQQCCQVRKLQPLQRVLGTLDVWITGLRREQAVTRTATQTIEWDEAHQLLKLNPLANWTTEEVWQYLRDHQVPYNPLHDRNYPSIGCAPCTRAIAAGEDLRAGRWWWEAPEHKECGLHYRNGRLERVRET